MQFLRTSCFIEAGLDECGDGIVTGDEECDCGRDAMGRSLCTPTSCCTSLCKINVAAGHQCSPQNPLRYPCCNTDCTFKSHGEQCHEADDCADDSVCNGTSAACPNQNAKPDDSPCNCKNGNCTQYPNTNPQICQDGVCLAFVCETYGAVQCGLPHPYTCQLGCRGPGFGDGESCVSTFSSPERLPPTLYGGRDLGPGTPCRASMGLCDAVGDCILVNPSDAPKAPQWTKVVVDEYWQEAVVGCVLAILLLTFFVQYRIRRKRLANRAASERAYLLAAANEEFEMNEKDRVLWDENEDEYANGYAA